MDLGRDPKCVPIKWGLTLNNGWEPVEWAVWYDGTPANGGYWMRVTAI